MLAVTGNRSTLPYGVPSQKTAFFIVTAVKNSILHSFHKHLLVMQELYR
jgi:hypothetical protein